MLDIKELILIFHSHAQLDSVLRDAQASEKRSSKQMHYFAQLENKSMFTAQTIFIHLLSFI